jgi:hypothetical protein
MLLDLLLSLLLAVYRLVLNQLEQLLLLLLVVELLLLLLLLLLVVELLVVELRYEMIMLN